jgi:valyl-tRNA synthetase
LIRDVERLFQRHQYGEACRQIYDFFWSEFADWYLEVAKLQVAEGGDRAFYTGYTLVQILDLCLRLLHPFTPFVTEELWGHLKQMAQSHSDQLAPKPNWPEALIIAPWPESRAEEDWEADAVKSFNLVQEIVRAIRNARSENNVTPGVRIPATFVSREFAQILRQQADTMAILAKLDPDKINIIERLSDKPEDHIVLVIGPVEVYLPMKGLVDVEAERERLSRDLSNIEAQITRLEELLVGPFAEKAPSQVVEKERTKLAAFRETADRLRVQLNELD